MVAIDNYAKLLVLNCYIYKFSMILKLPISHHDYRYLKYRSLTNTRFFTALTIAKTCNQSTQFTFRKHIQKITLEKL
ncbi:hypothetical protein Hanom_Chr11g00970551 [Helianthus anomalus]